VTAINARLAAHIPKVAELVAAQLRQRIITGELADGDELPRESDLVEEFGVSRPSLREALRILETEGLIRIRRGKIGGAVARRPTARSAAYHLGLTLQSHGVTHADFATARLSIEPICAAFAARLPERQAVVDELTDLVDESERCRTMPSFTDAAHRFHLRLTELCGNSTIVLVAGTLSALWSSQESRVASSGDPRSEAGSWRLRDHSVAAHRRLIALIAAGDGDNAALEMRRHISVTQESTLELYGSAVIEVVDRDPRHVVPPVSADAS
jgi:DNA-binding FadR family transcriptional regulator